MSRPSLALEPASAAQVTFGHAHLPAKQLGLYYHLMMIFPQQMPMLWGGNFYPRTAKVYAALLVGLGTIDCTPWPQWLCILSSPHKLVVIRSRLRCWRCPGRSVYLYQRPYQPHRATYPVLLPPVHDFPWAEIKWMAELPTNCRMICVLTLKVGYCFGH